MRLLAENIASRVDVGNTIRPIIFDDFVIIKASFQAVLHAQRVEMVRYCIV